MVVHAQLEWVRDMVMQGCPIQVSTTPGAAGGRAKLKILLFHAQPATSHIVQQVFLAVINHLALLTQSYRCVDRGHSHIGTQTSEICIWLSANASAPDVCAPQAVGGAGFEVQPEHSEDIAGTSGHSWQAASTADSRTTARSDLTRAWSQPTTQWHHSEAEWQNPVASWHHHTSRWPSHFRRAVARPGGT